jgi:multicomponent Na+:H+ antiporter subunit D
MSATIYYVVHHIVVQTALFLAAGLIEQVGGTTAIPKLGGMLAAAPVVAILYLVPALNLGGIPPFSGFLGKLGLFEAAIASGDGFAWVNVAAGALVSLLTLYALMRVWSRVFWSPAPNPEEGEEPLVLRPRTPRLMVAATVGLVAVTVALTVVAGPLYEYGDRAAAVLGERGYVTAVFPDGVPGGLDD